MSHFTTGCNRRRLGFALAILFGLASNGRAAIIGNYDLTTETLANSFGPLGALSVVASGGTQSFGPSGWSWSGATYPGTGLSIGGLPGNEDGNTVFGNYTIGLRFSLGEVTGLLKRVIHFKNDDNGQYVEAGTFQFVNGSGNPSGGSISANTTVDFVLTRDAATNLVTGYLNGSSTPIWSFTDTTTAQTDTGLTLQFFRDNTGMFNEFSTSGTVSLIRLWDAPLSAAEIPTAMVPVPEPATMLLLAAAAGGAILHARRRRCRQR